MPRDSQPDSDQTWNPRRPEPDLDLYDARGIHAMMAPHCVGIYPQVYTMHGFERATRELGAESSFQDRIAYQDKTFNAHHRHDDDVDPFDRTMRRTPFHDDVRTAMTEMRSYANVDENHIVLANHHTGRPRPGDRRARLAVRSLAFHELGHLVHAQVATPRHPLGPDVARLIRCAAQSRASDWHRISEDVANEQALALAYRHSEECFAQAFAVTCLLHDGQDDRQAIMAMMLRYADKDFEATILARRAHAQTNGLPTPALESLAQVMRQGVYMTLRAEMLAFRSERSPNPITRVRQALEAAKRGALPLELVVEVGAGIADRTHILDEATMDLLATAEAPRKARRRITADCLARLGLDPSEGINAAFDRMTELAGDDFAISDSALPALREHMERWCDQFLGRRRNLAVAALAAPTAMPAPAAAPPTLAGTDRNGDAEPALIAAWHPAIRFEHRQNNLRIVILNWICERGMPNLSEVSFRLGRRPGSTIQIKAHFEAVATTTDVAWVGNLQTRVSATFRDDVVLEPKIEVDAAANFGFLEDGRVTLQEEFARHGTPLAR